MSKLETIQRTSLVQEVCNVLKTKIQQKQYALHEKLPTEPELMQQFGVGRSTIREAILLLVNSGYLSVQQGSGTFVISEAGTEALDTTLGKASLDDLQEVRQLLEAKIAEKAAVNHKVKDITRMTKFLADRKKYAESNNLPACVKADIAFHLSIAESCGNLILTELYKATTEKISKSFLQVYNDTAPFIKTHPLHEELLQHIKDRNPSKTLQVVSRIIGKV